MTGIGADNRKWWVLAAMGAILGVILLDETVVGVALAKMRADLGMSEVASHWVVNVYMLVLAGLAAAAGKFGDIAGHKTVMNAGLATFGLASIACGFADSGAWLITARGIQGVGAAIIFPSSLAMLTIAFPEQQRGLAIGIAGAIGTVFLALGAPERIDRTGFVLLVGGISMLVFAVMNGPDWSWADPAIAVLLVAGVALLVAFVAAERRKAEPLIDVRLFANPTFAGCNLVIFAAQFTKMAVFIFGALYLQDVLKMSPLMAGLALSPTVAPQPFMAPLSGRAADRFGARWPSLVGLALMLAGLTWTGVAMFQNSYALMFTGLLAWGVSMAFMFVPPQRAVMGAVPPEKRGQAGGIAMSSQLIGATVGMAVCSTLFTSTNSFQVVFLTNAAFTFVVLVVAWLTIDEGA